MLLYNQLLHQYAGSKFCLQYIHTSGQGGCINRYGGIADIRLAPLLHYLPITIDQFKTADAVKFTASVLRSMVKILLFDSTAVAQVSRMDCSRGDAVKWISRAGSTLSSVVTKNRYTTTSLRQESLLPSGSQGNDHAEKYAKLFPPKFPRTRYFPPPGGRIVL